MSGLDALKGRMQALGMKPVVKPDGTVEGTVPFRNLVNAFTRSAILAATVRNYGEDAVVCVAPAHLAHLPSVKILALPNLAAFEAQIHLLYQRRLEKLAEANEFLAAMKLPAQLDEPGFRVTSDIWIGSEQVRFTVRQGVVLQLLSIAGTSLDAIDPRERRIDAKKVRTPGSLAELLKPLVAKLMKREPAAGPAPASAPVATARPATPTPPISKRAQNEMFDHAFAVLSEEEPADETTFGSLIMPEETATAATADGGAADVPMIALVCRACGSFYLSPEKPSDARLLDTCPKCLGLA